MRLHLAEVLSKVTYETVHRISRGCGIHGLCEKHLSCIEYFGGRAYLAVNAFEIAIFFIAAVFIWLFIGAG